MATKAKKKAKAKARPRKARTGFLPGMEPKEHKAVHVAAVAYADLRDDRMAMLRQEVEAQAKLVEEMGKAGITSYRYADVSAEIVSKRKVKVKIGGSSNGDENGENE